MARRHWRKFERRRVAVTLSNDMTVLGVLWETSPEFFELRDVMIPVEGRGDVPADGVMVVERARVLYLQVLA